jgi:hypothetical protein
VGGINYSNLSVYESELLCASAAESLESGFQAAISQCGGKEMGIYNKLPLYSESSTGQTCGRYDQLNTGSQALFSQFCGTDCDVGGGICKSRKGDPDITVACGKYCKVSGTSCVTDDSKSGGFLGKKFFEICNDYGSVLTANVIYCAREANCNQEQLKGLCKWQL